MSKLHSGIGLHFLYDNNKGALLLDGHSYFKLYVGIHSNVDVLGEEGESVGIVDSDHIGIPIYTYFVGDVGEVEMHIDTLKFVIE